MYVCVYTQRDLWGIGLDDFGGRQIPSSAVGRSEMHTKNECLISSPEAKTN